MRFLILAITLFSPIVLASDYGNMNAEKLPEAAQWQYAIGKWQVTTQYLDEKGELQTAPNKATVIVEFLPDGITLQSQFIMADSFYSVQIIAYDKKREVWVGNFVNSTRQRWTETQSRWVNDHMITLVPRGFSNSEAFMQRSVDTPIKDGHFTKRVDRSFDLGSSWKEGVFVMDFKRVD